MIKKLNILSLLLLFNFNDNIISMKVSDLANEPENLEQNSAFLNLPEEIIQSIIAQLIDTNKIDNFLKKIKDAENIFQLYSLKAMNYKNILINFKKELIANLNNIGQTSLQLSYSAKYYVNKLIKYYRYKLRYKFEEKEQEFIKEIKEQYAYYDQDKLNMALKNILNLGLNINRRNLEEATILIIAGADVNLKNNDGNTNLIRAVFKGYSDIVKLLLNNKDIDVNIQNQLGYTALMDAARQGYKDVVELLLNHKNINIDIQDNLGRTALMWAKFQYHKDIVKLIEEKMNKSNF